MKKNYETPSVEKVAFMYRDQVVVASNSFITTCENSGTKDYEKCWEMDLGRNEK